MTTSIARRAAVQLVTLASAMLSAAYYYQQAPETFTEIGNVSFNTVAVGIAVTAFALDAVKPEMARIAGDTTSGLIRRMAAAAVFLILFIASMIAVDGFLVKMRSDWAATRGTAITGYADARRVVTGLEAELALVAHARTTEQVKSALDKVAVSKRAFEDTNKCTRLIDADDRRVCRPVLDLREEMAAAIRKGDVEIKLADARAALGKLTLPKSADPQADALASWSGVKVDVVAYLMVTVLGFAVELVACLGVWLVQRPKGSSPTAEPFGTAANRSKTPATTAWQATPEPFDGSLNSSANRSEASKSEPNGSKAKLNRSAKVPEPSEDNPKGSESRLEIERFVMTEVALGRTIGSQQQLVERFGCAASTVSDVLGDLEARRIVRRRIDGRCKITEAA